jgi:hypothetical protein
MTHAMRTALRIAKKREGVGTRKNLSEFDAFMKEWRDGLKREGQGWDGTRAVAELKRKGMLEFLMAEGGAQNGRATRHLFRRMFHETQSYKKELAGSLLKERLDRVDESLRRIQVKVQREKDLANDTEIEEILQRLGADILKARVAVRWSTFNREKLNFGFLQELLWPEVPRRRLVSRRIEADTRLQIELAKVLMLYLRQKGISLETIARLILLAYWAGGLSEAESGFSRSRLTGRALKVRNIRENLRDAKLHDAPGFGLKRTSALKRKLRQASKILGPASSNIGVLPRLYLSKVATRFGLTKKQIAGMITGNARI